MRTLMAATSIVLVALSSVILSGCTFDIGPTEGVAPTPTDSATGSSAVFAEDVSEFVTVDFIDDMPTALTETTASLVAWAEAYCEDTDLSPCSGIAERAVPLCIERRDCHAAILVPFDEGNAAFLTGGVIEGRQVVAVWHPESEPKLKQYGGAQEFLEAHLLTLGVCRANGDAKLRGPECTI